MGDNIKVICRFRPLNKSEQTMNKAPVAEFIDSTKLRIKKETNEPISSGHDFVFDHIFPSNTTQRQMYEVTAKPVVASCLAGFNGTVFAYGQTSSGKTFTMQGADIHDPELKGLTPRMIEEIYQTIEETPDTTEFLIQVAITEIYKEKLRDLLDVSKTDLKIRESPNRGIYVDGVTEKYAATQDDVWNYMEAAYANRIVGYTNMNEGSSRSHLIVMISIYQNDKLVQNAKRSKLFLIDLAGSEKISKTGAAGERLEEAKKINQSLSALGNVINALTDGKAAFIPYRNSVLTRMLQDSIGGNSKTTLIITCSPSEFNLQETIGTLRFGERAKKIKNMAKINREMTVAELTKELDRTNKKMAILEKKIKFLEEFIVSNNLEVPHFDEDDEKPAQNKEDKKAKEKKQVDPKNEDDEDEDYTPPSDEGSDDEDQDTNINLQLQIEHNEKQVELFQKIANQYEETKKSLERELYLSRKNISYQNEKLNFNKNEISNLKNSLLNREKENENLVKKVAETTLSNKMMIQKQEPLKKRIDSLEQLNKTLQSQIDDLKKSRVVSKKENLNEGTISEKPKQDPSLPSGLYDLLKELVDKPGLGISYTLKIKNYLNDIDPPQTKKPKGKDMAFLNALSLLKRTLLGFNVNDKSLGNALDALKNLEIDEQSSNAIQIVFNKIVMSSKDGSKTQSKADNSYKPEPEKFESTSALQMKYEDLKKSSEQEVQRLNNHVKALMEKLTDAKDKKPGEKTQNQVLEEKNTQIKVQQDQINTLKDKIKELQAASKKAAAEQEEEDIIKEKSPTKRPTGSRNLEEAEIKNTGNMIKSVARTSVRFGARRDM